MTITSTEIETVVDDLTAHEFDIVCDVFYFSTGDCPEPARWAGIKACCGAVALICTSCKDRRMETDGHTECKHCLAVRPFRDCYLYIEPIRGKQ